MKMTKVITDLVACQKTVNDATLLLFCITPGLIKKLNFIKMIFLLKKI